jgi:N,N'-diacetyllegionaminate synthase|tara:strand:- start:3047 stop:3874 length:828 start_codon:yes stop_codon:yes gene_type:complete
MTILVAEIGWNFIGNLKLAKKMVLAAKKSGADAVKFQIWNPINLKKGPWDKDGRRKIYEKAFLNKERYISLKKYSKKIEIKCFASAFNLEGLKTLKAAKDSWVKIPSHESYNLELIKFALKNFKKIIISAGCLKRNELNNLIKFINSKKEYKKKTCLLHCVSSYPLEPMNCNFEKFYYLKKVYNKVGYSGHFSGIEDAVYALFNNAEIIEKHFTINNKLPGRDNKFALNQKQFSELNKLRILSRHFNKSNGLGLQKCEKDIYKNYRARWSKNIEI